MPEVRSKSTTTGLVRTGDAELGKPQGWCVQFPILKGVCDVTRRTRALCTAFDAMFNTPDIDIADEIFATEFTHRPADGAGVQGSSQLSGLRVSLYLAFPDLRQETTTAADER